jgi:hypothetical protein
MATEEERERPSYERINYSLRPAKAIERRMFCDVFSRLYPFQPVENYGYIGLGSIYLTDFQLFHRVLGICELISIERDADNSERFILNLPFGCIKMRFAESGAVLPTLNWENRQIVWLDYDGSLSLADLADIATVVSKASSGTFVALSVNAHPIAKPGDQEVRSIEEKTSEKFNLPKYRLEKIKHFLGQKVPSTVDGKMLDIEGIPKVLRKIISNEIESQLSTRNNLLPQEEQFEFKQVVNFVYRDGAQMLTLGGMIYKKSERAFLESCRFNELDFTSESEKPFLIKVPCLTPREMRHLNSFLPTQDTSKITRGGIPEDDIARYTEIYRYFPSFSEVLFH